MTQVTTTTTTLTIGIDLGDRFSHFCALDAEGEVLEEGRLGRHRLAQGVLMLPAPRYAPAATIDSITQASNRTYCEATMRSTWSISCNRRRGSA